MTRPEDARRIGLIADTHSQTEGWIDLPDSVLRAFEGLDLILHLGDAGDWRVLDRLQGIAPVIGALGGHNGVARTRASAARRGRCNWDPNVSGWCMT